MAPSREVCAVAMAMAAPFIAMASNMQGVVSVDGNAEKRRRTSSDALQRTVSDVSYELHHHVGAKGTTMVDDAAAAEQKQQLDDIAEVEDARCECCGMSEECTPEYIRGVRARFAGRLVCGLCAEAVAEEAARRGGAGGVEAALRAHTAVCKRFNGFGRTHPVLFQAEAMREILRKRSKLGPRSRSSINPREARQAGAAGGGGIARSSSCLPFITDEFSQRVNIN
ncbi:uncharacterized protein [Oryza sativa Japonica Group]|nr:uncharacterized protein LOC4341276 [Oryza sativa Japonica Group]KAF2927166.1 hypothetical protein DAI22_06g184900 [Oryza sativa Japonica Group]